MQKELMDKIENHNRKIKEAFNIESTTSTKVENEVNITTNTFLILNHDEWKLNIKELDKLLDEKIENSIYDVEVDINYCFKGKNVKISSYKFSFKGENFITNYYYIHAIKFITKKKAD